jgi:asparagine synthase (glutamine-hydrolysing)
VCGIAGFEASAADPHAARVLAESLANRGPDGEWIVGRDSFTLVQTRLAVIDLSDRVRYPMPNETGDVWLLFNGEIYGHAGLRRELERRGHSFATSCDAEVVVHAYEEWGIDGFRRLNGMFAVALLDERAGRLVLARDPFGIKPLVRRLGAPFAFASDVLSLVRAGLSEGRIDTRAMEEYASFHYVPPPGTGIEDVGQIDPGTALIRSFDGSEQTVRWAGPPLWSTAPAGRPARLEELDAALSAAVGRQLVADVGVGIFLSGGVDSALLLSYAAELDARPRAFTISFPGYGDYDEAAHASRLAGAFGVPHVIAPFDFGFEDAVARTAETFDCPFGDSSAIATLQLAALARPYVTVALSGTGGDELFGGYYRLRAHKIRRLARLVHTAANRMGSGVARGSHRHSGVALTRSYLGRLAEASTSDDVAQYLDLVARSTSPAGLAALELQVDSHAVGQRVAHRHGLEREAAVSRLSQLQQFELLTYLPGDLLTKEDRATMSVGLESRVPLLDDDVASVAARLPERDRTHVLRGKVALRRLARRRLGAVKVPLRKRGFAVPLGSLFAGAWRSESIEWFSGGTSELVAGPRVAGMIEAGEHDAADTWALAALAGWEENVRRARVRTPAHGAK